jgi:hypothetical protein
MFDRRQMHVSANIPQGSMNQAGLGPTLWWEEHGEEEDEGEDGDAMEE